MTNKSRNSNQIELSAPTFAKLLEGTALSIEVMDPQPLFDHKGGCWYPFHPRQGEVDAAGEFQNAIANAPYKHLHYGNEKHFLKGVAEDFAPHREGDTVLVPWEDDPYKERMFNEDQSPSRGEVKATVVSVTAKLEREVTCEEWERTGLEGDTAPFGKGYVWLTELRLER